MSYACSHGPRRFAVVTAVAVVLAFGTATTAAHHEASGAIHTGTSAPLILAGTVGMERRQDNRDERQDDRGDRRDDRQDCRDEEGVAGKDKRDCKQEGRQEHREDAKD